MGLFDRFKKNVKTAQPTDVNIADAKVTDRKVTDRKVTDGKIVEVAKKPVAKQQTAKQLPTKKVEKKSAATGTPSSKQLAIEILLQPIVTEKASVSGAYYFKVKSTTNRNEVKKAFATLYGKIPRKVNIMNQAGKKVRFGKLNGKRNDWKKAVVYLNKDETVDVFSE